MRLWHHEGECLEVYGTMSGRAMRVHVTMRWIAMRVYGTMSGRAMRLYVTMRGRAMRVMPP